MLYRLLIMKACALLVFMRIQLGMGSDGIKHLENSPHTPRVTAR